MGLLNEMAQARMEDFPDTPLEQAEMLKGILISRAIGSSASEPYYRALRHAFLDDPQTKNCCYPSFGPAGLFPNSGATLKNGATAMRDGGTIFAKPFIPSWSSSKSKWNAGRCVDL